MSKKFERPSQTVVTATDKTVSVPVANVTETPVEVSAVNDTTKTFVTYEEMMNSERGHNFPKKITPLKQERGFLAETPDNDEIVSLSVEDLTYISLSIDPKALERYLTKLGNDRIIKSIRVYNGPKGPYLYASLDKNIAIDRGQKTNLLEVLDRRLSQRLNVDAVTKGPLKSLLCTDYRANLIDKGDEIGFIFDLSTALSMFVTSHVFSTAQLDNLKLQQAISTQFRISEEIVFEGGKIQVAFSFVNKQGSTLLLKLPMENIVGLNSSMTLAKFKAKVDKYLQDNVDTSARVEYINFAKLLRTEAVAGLSPVDTEKAKANQKLITELSGNTGSNNGGLNVSSVPLVLLDQAFSQERHVFHNSTLNELLKPIPSREGVKRDLVARRLGSLLTDDIMSFAIDDSTVAILTDIAKLVMTVELGGIKDLRLSVVTTDNYLAYNFTV